MRALFLLSALLCVSCSCAGAPTLPPDTYTMTKIDPVEHDLWMCARMKPQTDTEPGEAKCISAPTFMQMYLEESGQAPKKTECPTGKGCL